MPSVYNQVFGGSLVAPAVPTYLPLSISANVVLAWPLESVITSPAAAEIIDVTATTGGLTVQLSDARQISTGYCALFNNVGANTFTLLDAQGNVLMAPASGQAWQIYLADNSTLQGTWRVFQYGAGVSNANAASLAGAGLIALTTTLNLNVVTNAQSANYNAVLGDRAKALEWTGGVGTLTLPNNTTIPAGWFCAVKNSGTGGWTVSVSGGFTIDGNANLVLTPEQSCFLIFDGTNFYTLGLGQQLNSIFDFVQISLSGESGNFVLSGPNLNRISYRFVGALAGPVTVVVPNTVQQYWVDNETTGAFTLSVATPTPGTITAVGQGTRNILYSDGINVVTAVTFGSTGFAAGSAGAPSIFFTPSPATGIYSPAANALGVSTSGTERIQIDAAGHVTFEAPDNTASIGFVFNQSGAGAGTTVQITSPFSSVAASPLLQLESTGANGFATLSLSANSGVAGTSDLSIFQNGATLDASILNRANAALILGTNGVTRGSVTGVGAWSFLAPSTNPAVQITTATYTFGNPTDNPAFDFVGSGITAFSTSPTGPTPSPGDNSTKLATTAFVVTGFAPLNSPALTGVPTAPTATGGTNTAQIATTAFVTGAGFAPLNSPGFTGVPTAPTAAIGTSSTQLATTAFVNPAFNISSNGHLELPSGLILQWGHVTAASGTSPVDIAVTFPIPFPNACFHVSATSNRSVAAAGQANLASNFAVGYLGAGPVTGCTITIDNQTGNPSTYSGTWFAIGW
jgi:hypothetical protein